MGGTRRRSWIWSSRCTSARTMHGTRWRCSSSRRSGACCSSTARASPQAREVAAHLAAPLAGRVVYTSAPMRIARFTCDGKIYHGQLVDEHSARVIEGDLFAQHRVTDRVIKIDKLLAPLVPTDILCI